VILFVPSTAVTVKVNAAPAVAVPGAVTKKCVACACAAGARSTRRTGIASAAITQERALANTGVARENFCISIITLPSESPARYPVRFPTLYTCQGYHGKPVFGSFFEYL
jgi:hypothetical protein